MAEHQAKRARSSQADAQPTKHRVPHPSSPQTAPRSSAQPTQATSSTAVPSHVTDQGGHASAHGTTGQNVPSATAPAHVGASAVEPQGDVPKRKGPPSVLASIVVAMDEPSPMQAAHAKHPARPHQHAIADGWSLPAGLHAATPDNLLQARRDSHAQAGPRVSPGTGRLPHGALKPNSSSCKPGHQSHGGVIAKMTSGRGRGHKSAANRASGMGKNGVSRPVGSGSSQGGVSIATHRPFDRLPADAHLPGEACKYSLMQMLCWASHPAGL